jgi:hypothetical protein
MNDWRIVEGFPDYEINRQGAIRRCVPDARGRLSGKCLSPIPRKKGEYLQVSLYRGGIAHPVYVHRLVALNFREA